MAEIAKWNSRWNGVDSDSDVEDAGFSPELDADTRAVLERFPPDVASKIAQERHGRRREALLALHCFLAEISGPPRETPHAQQRLLGALSETMKQLEEKEEGTQNDMLLMHVFEALRHNQVHPCHAQHAIGAMALLAPQAREPMLTEFVLRAGLARAKELPAHSLARACWSAAILAGEFQSADELLRTAVSLVRGKARDFQVDDVGIVAWACAIKRPPGARETMEALAVAGKLPAPSSPDAGVTAWALECLGIDASPHFGLPPQHVPVELAQGLHERLRALRRRDDVHDLHAGDPFVLSIDGLIVAEEADALLSLVASQWECSTKGADLTTARRTSDSALPQTLAGLRVPILERVRRRAASLVGLPESHCEPPQVVRYKSGDKCEEHTDYLVNTGEGRGLIYLGGQRVATVLLYLVTLPTGAGGCTCFRRLGVLSTPILGTALLWLNVRPDGEFEERTTYAAEPVEAEGSIKYCLNFWFRAYPITQAEDAMEPASASALGCEACPLPQVPLPLRPAADFDGMGISQKSVSPRTRPAAGKRGHLRGDPLHSHPDAQATAPPPSFDFDECESHGSDPVELLRATEAGGEGSVPSMQNHYEPPRSCFAARVPVRAEDFEQVD